MLTFSDSRHRPQGGLRQTVVGEVHDDAVEQLLTTLEIRGTGHGCAP